MQLFYSTAIEDSIIHLEGDEARHCTQVLRKQKGDRIHVVDGMGGWYEIELTDINKKSCAGLILQSRQEFDKLPFHIHIGIAPTKNIARLEWFLEKCTEIGISEISLLLCHHSERQKLRLDRLERILVAAMKQSLKAYLPKLNELENFKQFLQAHKFPASKYIAHCQEGDKVLLKNNYQAGSDVCILIGPEGDFSGEEITLALAAGFQSLSLGNNRLRTETAGVVACHSINMINE